MNNTYYTNDPRAVLIHFNPNHDPDNGQFTDKKGGHSGGKFDKQGSKSYNKMINEMREGIKKDRIREKMGIQSDKPSSKKKGLTEQQKKAIKIATIGAVAAVGVTAGIIIAQRLHATEKIKGLLDAGVTDKKQFQDVMTEAIDEETEILKAGTIIHRMEGMAGRDISKESGITYGAYKPKDRAVYMTMLADWAGTGKRYDASYEAIKDLKIPTEQKARQIFDTLWKENPQYQKALTDTLVAEARKQNPLLGLCSPDFVEKAFRQALGERGNDDFYVGVYAMVKRGKDSDMLTKALKDAGYDALHDYHDIKDQLAQSPIILLDPKSEVIKKGEIEVSRAVKTKTLKTLLKEGVTELPTHIKELASLNNERGNVDIKKLLNQIKYGLM